MPPIEVSWENALLPPAFLAIVITVGLFVTFRNPSAREDLVKVQQRLPAVAWLILGAVGLGMLAAVVYWNFTMNQHPSGVPALKKALSWGLIPLLAVFCATSLSLGTIGKHD